MLGLRAEIRSAGSPLQRAETAERPDLDEGPADDEALVHGAEDAAIVGVRPVVAKDEHLAFADDNDAGLTLNGLDVVAQVRFDKTITRGVAPPTRTRYISTLTVRYERGNIPSQIRDLHVNAFGFCAVNYRRDQEGVPQVLGPPAAGSAEQGGFAPAAALPITPANEGMPQAAAR